MAIAAVLVVLASVHLLVLGTLRSTTSGLEAESLRIETTRAFFAAEAATWVSLQAALSGREAPAEGSTIELGSAMVEFIESSISGGTGSVVLEGTSGFGVRRVEITLD